MKRSSLVLVALLAAALAACQWLPKLGSQTADASPTPSPAAAAAAPAATPAGDTSAAAVETPEPVTPAEAYRQAEAAAAPPVAPEQARSARSSRPAANERRASVTRPASGATAPEPAEPAESAAAAPAEVPAPAPTPEPVVLAAGTTLPITIHQALATDRSHPEDAVSAELAEDVKVDGRVVLPAGTEVLGHVVVARQAGRVKGRARLVVAFDEIRSGGRSYQIDVPRWDITAGSSRGKDAKIAGGAAAAGAIIGALAGGGRGAVRGGLIGGAAGGAAVLATRGNEVELRAGARHRITLRSSVQLD